MTLEGDFCFVIWFETLKDAKHFENILRRRKIMAWHFKTKWDYAVVWDIGKH